MQGGVVPRRPTGRGSERGRLLPVLLWGISWIVVTLAGGTPAALAQTKGEASFDQAEAGVAPASTGSRNAEAKESRTPKPEESTPETFRATSASAAAAPESEGGGPSAAAAGGTAASAGEGLDAATYRVRLRDLERRIEALKEQIRRSHTRLSLLSDQIMSGVDSGGRVEIQFENDLSDAWRVIELVVVLDGVVQYKKSDTTGALSAQKLIPIFSGSLGKGDHVVQVMMKLRGHGFGLFSYLRGLDATVRNDHSFSLSRGKATEIKVTAWEQGGPTTSAEERPSLRFNEMSTGGSGPRRSRAATPASASEPGGSGPEKATGKD